MRLECQMLVLHYFLKESIKLCPNSANEMLTVNITSFPKKVSNFVQLFANVNCKRYFIS